MLLAREARRGKRRKGFEWVFPLTQGPHTEYELDVLMACKPCVAALFGNYQQVRAEQVTPKRPRMVLAHEPE